MSSVILLRESSNGMEEFHVPYVKWQGKFSDEKMWRRCFRVKDMIVLPLANGGWVDVTSKTLEAQRARTN